MYTGSIPKSFIAVVILQLVDPPGHPEASKLQLDTLADEYLKDPSLGWSWSDVQGKKKITIRQLLNHTSGLYNYTDDYPTG